MYDPVTELEHYGVLGMKWGVRRTPAQLGNRQERKLNRYKKKEIEKIKKRMASDKADRQLYKDNFKRVKADYKSKKSSAEEYEDAKEFNSLSQLDFKLRKKEALAEIDAIKKMPYKDMQDRKKQASLKRNLAIGAGVATAALATYGAYKYKQIVADKRIADYLKWNTVNIPEKMKVSAITNPILPLKNSERRNSKILLDPDFVGNSKMAYKYYLRDLY